jgi:hypothetical protein
MRRHAATSLLAALLAAMTLPSPPAAASSNPVAPTPGAEGEEFHYRWRLGSLLGKVAGIFLPSQGDGVLSFTPTDHRLRSELLITSEQSRAGEYWQYGSEVDADQRHAVRAWSSSAWKGEEKSKSEEIEQRGVLDVVSGIYAIRRDPPENPRTMEIWSDGKIYPVVVVPRGREVREIDGKKIPTRHFQVRGYEAKGGRKWKGKLELWLAEDPAATPVEIRIERSLADLRLELVGYPAGR